VGYVSTPQVAPAKWSRSGALTMLALPPGDKFGFATAINNRGQIVGPESNTFLNDLTADRILGSINVGSDLRVARWSFTLRFQFRGFFPPVANPGPAPYNINQVKAGQPVPVRFSLGETKG
jgi:hypothetical protein